MAVQDAAGTWFQLDLSGPVIPAGWWGVVAGDESKAAQNGIAINRAMAALGARSGGTLQLPAGDIWVDRTLDNRFSYVLVRGQGMGSSHDTGAPPVGTRILPTAPVTVLRHRSQTAAERGVPPAQNFKTVGGGFDNLMVDGAGIAPRLLHVTSVTHALHRLYLANAVSPAPKRRSTTPTRITASARAKRSSSARPGTINTGWCRCRCARIRGAARALSTA